MKDNYFNETSNHEWILTNKIGGYALGTGNLINQRKYHGLLISSDDNLNRHNLLAGLEMVLEWRGERCYLDSTNYSSCIYPEGFLHLVKSWLRPYPIFLYSSLHHSNDILVKKEIMMADDENTVMVKITNLSYHKLNFFIKPKVTMRSHHDTNSPGTWDYDNKGLQLTERDFLFQHNKLALYGVIHNGAIHPDGNIYRDCYYPWEAIRGYNGVEDQYTPVNISFSLRYGETNYLFFSDLKENFQEISLDKKIEKIEKKYSELPLPKDYPASNDSDNPLLHRLDFQDQIMFDYKEYLRILEFSLHDFHIKEDVIAGYPWFGCWGRDTFIYFDALIKSVVNHRQCWMIIKKYASLIKNGLIPNMLTESARDLNYHSIDSSLWFVLRIYDFVNKVVSENLYGQKTIISESVGYCEEIIKGILDNTEYPFFIADNGLLYLKEEFSTATWMDVRINGNAITPRNGAPVEINALFYNALCIFKELTEDYLPKKMMQTELIKRVTVQIDKIKESFSLFWIDDYLADRLERDLPVKEYRPNALIATSLPFSLLSSDKLKTVFQTATNELATPYGLRTLSPRDYRFKKKYLGNQKERDSQYHQGTVWAWLIDPYTKTYYNAYKGEKSSLEMVEDLTKIISNLRNGYMKGHISSIAEVWDGERPHFPKGCPAQAWSVAALVNAEHLINKLMQKD
ncbi:MAG: amylo-alpha-1,6-glucosidase [Candidatus Cloacimonetes bacterium]|nr:amylo-alpha-1,6-glucosidase [Candidatus Cloacimonadota bacterium]